MGFYTPVNMTTSKPPPPRSPGDSNTILGEPNQRTLILSVCICIHGILTKMIGIYRGESDKDDPRKGGTSGTKFLMSESPRSAGQGGGHIDGCVIILSMSQYEKIIR